MIYFFIISVLSKKHLKEQQVAGKYWSLSSTRNCYQIKALSFEKKNEDGKKEEDDDNDDENSLDFIFLIAIAAGGLVLVILLIVLVVVIAKMMNRSGRLSRKKSQVESSRVALLDNGDDRPNSPESHSAYVRPESNAALIRPETNTDFARPESNADFAKPDSAFILPESSLEILESSSISSVDIE